MKKHITAHSSETASLIDAAKPSLVKNLLVKILVFCVFVICFRFAYVVTLRGESCDVGDFCFFSSSSSSSSSVATSVITDDPTSSAYVSIFEDLMSEGFLTPTSKSLVAVLDAAVEEVHALRKLGVTNAVGVAKKAAKPLVFGVKNGTMLPFKGENFDFVFSGNAEMVTLFSEEILRTVKPEGYIVVHTRSNDTYSLHSLIALFNSCTFIKFRDIDYNNDGFIREIVMKKEHNGGGNVVNNKRECEVVPGYKQEIARKAENLIKEEPLKPWITLKRNIQNIKYLPNMVDISFKSRYVYVDVGARSYGSSIGSWFKKQYPKQNKTFDVYAIEADKSFYQEYEAKRKKNVKLLPYAAWVRNETLFFEVNHDPGDDPQEKGASGRGMGRIKPVQSDKDGGVDKIVGFDFAEWLKATVTQRDFVVMKMDVEGTEFELIPRLIETGAICLIDEIFLECHYNRWQRCCPGQRSAKYEKTYGQCLDLFTSLRNRGVLVHQWW